MGFFKKNFPGKSKDAFSAIHDYASVSTDIHSHLIWGIDDGVKSEEESVDMLIGFIKLGYKKVITTPHIMHDHYKNTPENIYAGLMKLREIIARKNLPIDVDAAAEYYIDEGFEQKLNSGKILTINNKFLLFEISYMNPPDNLARIIFDMITKDYTPLLAHPERYPFWSQKFDEFHKLKAQGVMLQLNIGSLTGYYGLQPKKIAEQLIDENLIDFIGSDLHGERHMQAMHQALKEKYLWKLLAQGVKNSLL